MPDGGLSRAAGRDRLRAEGAYLTAARYDTHDLRNRPNYSIGEVAHYLGLPSSTVRVWCFGQDYPTRRRGVRRAAPLIRPAGSSPPGLSFWNLVELYVLRAIRREHDVPLPRVRRALLYVQRELLNQRPFIDEQFYTDGASLFVKRYAELINATADGQFAMARMLEGSLARVERDTQGLAVRLFPWFRKPDEPRDICVDPGLAFGRPVIAGAGVPIDIVAERFRAGDKVEALARDYRVDGAAIQSALRCELLARAA